MTPVSGMCLVCMCVLIPAHHSELTHSPPLIACPSSHPCFIPLHRHQCVHSLPLHSPPQGHDSDSHRQRHSKPSGNHHLLPVLSAPGGTNNPSNSTPHQLPEVEQVGTFTSWAHRGKTQTLSSSLFGGESGLSQMNRSFVSRLMPSSAPSFSMAPPNPAHPQLVLRVWSTAQLARQHPRVMEGVLPHLVGVPHSQSSSSVVPDAGTAVARFWGQLAAAEAANRSAAVRGAAQRGEGKLGPGAAGECLVCMRLHFTLALSSLSISQLLICCTQRHMCIYYE